MTQTIEQLQAKVAELEEENELLKGRKNVELAANTDNAKSKQQRELAGPMEMGQLLAGSTHKTSGDLEIERTKPVTWIHKGGGFISDSRGKFIGCFSGDFRYRDRIICAVNSESETSKQLAAAQEECEFQRNAHKQAEELMLEQSNQLAAEQLNNKLLREDQELLVEAWNYGQFADDFNQPQAKPVRAAIRRFCETLSIPASTEALDQYVAEKVKEATATQKGYYEWVFQEGSKQIAKAFRQRDLAENVPVGYTAEELERDNPYNQWMYEGENAC